MRTKKFIILCGFIAILLVACVLSACGGSTNSGKTAPSASAEATPSVKPSSGLETGNPEGTEPGGDFSDIFGEATSTPATENTLAPTEVPETVAPTLKPTQVPATQTSKPTGGLSASTETPGQNWGPLS